MSDSLSARCETGVAPMMQQDAVTETEPLSSLTLMAALDDSQRAVLIFDADLRVLHLTTQAQRLLALSRPGAPLDGPEVTALLGQSCLDAGSVARAKAAMTDLQWDEASGPVELQCQDRATTLHMRLRSLPGGCRAAYLEASRRGEPVLTASLTDFALRDSLTGIATRRSLELALEAAGSTPAAVLMIDLDRFKAVNDTMGHAAGDTLLRLVAERLRVAVRSGDLAARFGGDEFAVLIYPAPEHTEIVGIAKRILDLVQRTYLIEGQLVNVGVSIGIAVSPADGTDPNTLLRNADLALYQSKSSGRATFHFFDVSMEQRALARRMSELELRRALALRQLEVHYQPQVTVLGNLVGFEALLRWKHPVRGMVLPGEFLPMAEEIGAIVPIGDWVLRTACKEATNWPGVTVLAVNASPLQIHNGTFADSVQRALKSTALPGERLEIEITEGMLLGNDEVVMRTLSDLRAMKVRIAMDDFGTGYASLSQLARFPFDKIKIDRSLAAFDGSDLKKRAIVRAITALGQSLGICTLAEGVENAEQLSRLQMDGCASVQGYLFGRPVPASELEGVISRLSEPMIAEFLSTKE